jgi:glutathione S-transferase
LTTPVTLYHASPSRSSTVLWMLEEIGHPYDVALVDIRDGRQRQSDFMQVNPLGKVPAIKHNNAIVTESCACVAYLADAFPAAKLAPAIGDPKRGPYLRWLFFYAGSWEPSIVDHAMKREAGPVAMSPYGNFDAVMDTVESALKTGPYLLGETFSAADVAFGSGLGWTMGFGLVPKRQAFIDYAARVDARPARKRAQAKDDALKATLT